MQNKEFLLELLRLVILKIRLLSGESYKDVDTKKQINELSDIIHNIPAALSEGDEFDYNLLFERLENFKHKYSDDVTDLLDLFEKYEIVHE